jgi:uncharacterized DUF497 family protein
VAIHWDKAKNQKLISDRGISFEDVAELVLKNEILDVLKNPVRQGQFYFILMIKGYTHIAPFVISEDGSIILKTVFPSRKLHKKYGGKK